MVDKVPASKTKKKSRKRPAQPQPGDPDYKTPTQLRNARKRRKKKQDKTAAVSAPSVSPTNDNGNAGATAIPGNSNSNRNDDSRISKIAKSNKDPSLKYLSNPRAAPTVRNAIKFFREKTHAAAGSNHDTYFPVMVGPKLGWRTVARLAVQTVPSTADADADADADAHPTASTKLRIGLFVPGSHDLLPVPDCPVHHRKINGLVRVLEDECNTLGVPALGGGDGDGDTDGGSGGFGLRYVAVAIERSTQKQQLVLVWKEDSSDPSKNDVLGRLIQRLVQLSHRKTHKDTTLHSIWVHYNNTWKHANSIFDREGRWETRFVDGSDTDADADAAKARARAKASDTDPLYGSIREVMLPPHHPGKAPDTNADNNNSSEPIRVPLYFPPQVFRQANLDGFAKIIARIREWLKEQPATMAAAAAAVHANTDDPPKRKRRRGKKDTSNANTKSERPSTATNTNTNTNTLGHCLELYGGVGTIGLNLADLFDSIESSDENPFNERCFHAAADELELGGGNLLSPSRRAKITYLSKSASDVVRDRRESLHSARVVIVDPPRKGLDPPVLEALCGNYHGGNQEQQQQQQQQALIYVSCGFDAFRRDYRALVEESGRWTLDCAEGHVLFPGSDAIETLAFFTRTK